MFAKVEVENVNAVEDKWLEYVDGQHADILKEIKKTGNLEGVTEKKLKKAMDLFQKANKGLFTKD